MRMLLPTLWYGSENLYLFVQKNAFLQEEYVSGDKVGILQCKHKYHVAGIQQWLRLKNGVPFLNQQQLLTLSDDIKPNQIVSTFSFMLGFTIYGTLCFLCTN